MLHVNVSHTYFEASEKCVSYFYPYVKLKFPMSHGVLIYYTFIHLIKTLIF